jgi:hypothetical protein
LIIYVYLKVYRWIDIIISSVEENIFNIFETLNGFELYLIDGEDKSGLLDLDDNEKVKIID